MTSCEIGLRVTRVREAKGLSTVRLAQKVGISQAQISRLENGKQGFRSSTLVRIAESLGVPPFYLLMDDDEWESYQTGLVVRGRPRVDVPAGPELRPEVRRDEGTGGPSGPAVSGG